MRSVVVAYSVTKMQARTVMEEANSKNWGKGELQRDATPARPVFGCEHKATEFLGSGGSIVFRRCTACGDVLFSQAGRTSAVPCA
ncbi:MAG: hypothetical protein V3U17_02770 [Thermoplasmata archaeon]